ncbi:MAG: helix-turn-helix domain-containing protein, partial [Solirubrobacterales bacterium]
MAGSSNNKKEVGVPGPRPLTRRESQIAKLAAKGVPNGKIAKRLGLSVRTVES